MNAFLTNKADASISVEIIPNDKSDPPGKVADAALYFNDGPLAGLKLIGFGVWERRTGGGLNVTFPARQYSVNGERRSFALLRPIVEQDAHDRVVTLIKDAYAEFVGAQEDTDRHSGGRLAGACSCSRGGNAATCECKG